VAYAGLVVGTAAIVGVGAGARTSTLVTVVRAQARRAVLARLRLVGRSQPRQRHARKADAEFLQGVAASDGLGHVPGQFIEFVVHNFLWLGFLISTKSRLGTRGHSPAASKGALPWMGRRACSKT
jgi:hypothetical protein